MDDPTSEPFCHICCTHHPRPKCVALPRELTEQEVARLRRKPSVNSAELSSLFNHIAALQQKIARLEKLLGGSVHALRSYEFGNASTGLAKEMADAIEEALAEPSEQEKP